MAGFSLPAVPLDALSPTGATKLSALNAQASALASKTANASAAAATPTAAETAKRAAIKKTAQAFEASFLSSMLQPMFEGVDAEAPFGGGAGEGAFKSFLTDAFAKQMSARGGVGIAGPVQREMLKLQGLSDTPGVPLAAPAATPLKRAA